MQQLHGHLYEKNTAAALNNRCTAGAAKAEKQLNISCTAGAGKAEKQLNIRFDAAEYVADKANHRRS